jgi:hypothetical protein
MKSLFFCLAVVALSAEAFGANAQDLPRWEDDDLTVNIHYAKSFFAGRGRAFYEFLVEIKGGAGEIEDLLMRTPAGDIVCGNTGGIGPVQPQACYLDAHGSFEGPAVITRAEGKIMGKRYDLTRSLRFSYFIPMEGTAPNSYDSSGGKCPNIVTPLFPAEGAIAGTNCDNGCFLVLRLSDGSSKSYSANSGLKDYIDSPLTWLKTGGIVKLQLRSHQVFIENETGECIKNEEVLEISPADS